MGHWEQIAADNIKARERRTARPAWRKFAEAIALTIASIIGTLWLLEPLIRALRWIWM